MRFWFKKWKECPDCVAKGKSSTWTVPAHVNHWAWGVIPEYKVRCFTCGGKGKVRDFDEMSS
jgi:RecJ-like exonuclease